MAIDRMHRADADMKPAKEAGEGLVAMIGLCLGVGAWALWELAGRIISLFEK